MLVRVENITKHISTQQHGFLGGKAAFYLISLYSFSSWYQKNLQKSSAIQNNSVILSSLIIAIIICKPFCFSTIKLQ